MKQHLEEGEDDGSGSNVPIPASRQRVGSSTKPSVSACSMCVSLVACTLRENVFDSSASYDGAHFATHRPFFTAIFRHMNGQNQ